MTVAHTRQSFLFPESTIKKEAYFLQGPLLLIPRAAVLALLVRKLTFVQDRRCGCPLRKIASFLLILLLLMPHSWPSTTALLQSSQNEKATTIFLSKLYKWTSSLNNIPASATLKHRRCGCFLQKIHCLVLTTVSYL